MTDGRLIGGVFALELGYTAADRSPPFLTGGELLLASARAGFGLVVDRLSPRSVWVPSFLCPTMLGPLECNLARLQFYAVDRALRPDPGDWLDAVRSRDLVVLIDYFGFPCDRQVASEARRRGAWVLEDACQALLTSGTGEAADAVLFSPRKFVGVPDGGILRMDRPADLGSVSLTAPPTRWWLTALEAAIRRREFDHHGGDRDWFRLFREAEAGMPIAPHAMSELSERLLRHAFDYAEVGRRRRENYLVLLDRLTDVAIFPDLPVGVVPLGFPIRVRDRDRVRQHLFDDAIYPAVHWPLGGTVPEDFVASHQLSAEIMTLPCDQRYGPADMDRVAGRVREGLRR